MPALPTGTVTFLFTELDLAEPGQASAAGSDALLAAEQRYTELVRAAVNAQGGVLYKVLGQSSQAAFSTARNAVAAAAAVQRSLAALRGRPGSGLPGDPEDRVPAPAARMALHTGALEAREFDYSGPLLNRVARLVAAGHGGQVLLTEAAQELVRDDLPAGLSLRDLGVHRLRDLVRPEHVYQLVIQGLGADFPPLRSQANRPDNLPAQPTPFVGRARQVAEVVDLLRQPDIRLLTLSGPGGTGKSRLALQAAAALLAGSPSSHTTSPAGGASPNAGFPVHDDLPDGIFFVPLAPLSDPNLVASAIAKVLGLHESGGQPIAEELAEYLRPRRLLLLLDNFEQVLPAAALVGRLLEVAAGLKVMVTSRAVLRLSSEHEFPVPPLALPDLAAPPDLDALRQTEAVVLFVTRAQALQPDFRLDAGNARAVAEICVQLDGLPLAIELAAARSKILPPRVMLARLSRRLNVLTGGVRDLPARQQTLRATLDWSYGLLGAGERMLFRRLAVFAGGMPLEAIEAVCGASQSGDQAEADDTAIDLLDGLSALVDNSLLRRSGDEANETRFRMLETIREYAADRLDQSAEGQVYHRRHAEYYTGFAEQGGAGLRGRAQETWLARLAEEHNNLRAALTWATSSGEGARALRLAAALGRFWELHGDLSEGRQWLAAALKADDEFSPPDDREPSSEVRSNLSDQTQAPVANGPAAPGTVAAPVSRAALRAEALDSAGWLAVLQNDLNTARILLEESLRLRRVVGDSKGTAGTLNNLGAACWAAGAYSEAHTMFEESVALYRAAGHEWGVGNTLGNLGLLASRMGEYEAAEAYLHESLALKRKLGDKHAIALSLVYLGDLELLRGRPDRAGVYYKQGLVLLAELRDRARVADNLESLGEVAVAAGDGVRAARLFGASMGQREPVGTKIVESDLPHYEEVLARARALVDEETWERAWQTGQALSFEDAIKYALE